MLSACWINDGFSDQPASGSTLEQVSPIIMPLTGARIDLKPAFIETTLTFPISAEHKIHFFPVGWSVALGVRI